MLDSKHQELSVGDRVVLVLEITEINGDRCSVRTPGDGVYLSLGHIDPAMLERVV